MMTLNEVVPPETVEFKYNKQYIPFETEKFDHECNMHPFVYPSERILTLKKLVIIWEANIKSKNDIDILSFKLECGYILDGCVKNEENSDRLENLLTILSIFSWSIINT